MRRPQWQGPMDRDCTCNALTANPGIGHEFGCGMSQEDIDRAAERRMREPVLCGHESCIDRRYICTEYDNHRGPHHGTDITGHHTHTWTLEKAA